MPALVRAAGRSRIERFQPRASRSRRAVVMSKFLIEVSHDPERVACARAVQVFLNSGSHFVTNADWGCRDGDHRAWMVVDVASKEEARAIVPTNYRSRANIVALNRFTLREIEDILREHAK
jgi:hypothetical protein